MMQRRHRAARLVLAAGMMVMAACSDSGGTATPNTRADTTPAPQDTAAPQASVPSPETTLPDTTVAATDQPPAASDVPGLVEGSLSDRECPSEDSISAAVGRPMTVDSSAVQAKGFCPYTSSDENVNVSVTFTPMDMTAFQDPNQTEVPGLGQKALWSDGSDELDVWFGNGSIIVSVLAFGQGPDFDTLTIASNVARSIAPT